jgi:selenocysteine lyase/cysteine desulfurase
LAALVGAEPAEVAFTGNTTEGLAIVSEGFPFRPGDNVVTSAEEYPSNIYPWLALARDGVATRMVPSRDGRVEVTDLLEAMDRRTRLVSISLVQWTTGYRLDLDRLGAACRERGVALCVDAIQGIPGTIVDLARAPVDFLATGGHKWLMGPQGSGFVVIRRAWLERLRPRVVGWHSVTTPYQNPAIHPVLRPTAERFEGGTHATGAILALGASAGLWLELGPEAVARRIEERAERVRELAVRHGWRIAGSIEPGARSGIVGLEKDGIDPDEVVGRARREGVVLVQRRGRVRVAAHVWNSDEDLERLGRILAETRA